MSQTKNIGLSWDECDNWTHGELALFICWNFNLMGLKTIMVFRRTDSNDFTGFFLHFIALHLVTPLPSHLWARISLNSLNFAPHPTPIWSMTWLEETCRGWIFSLDFKSCNYVISKKDITSCFYQILTGKSYFHFMLFSNIFSCKRTSSIIYDVWYESEWYHQLWK